MEITSHKGSIYNIQVESLDTAEMVDRMTKLGSLSLDKMMNFLITEKKQRTSNIMQLSKLLVLIVFLCAGGGGGAQCYCSCFSSNSSHRNQPAKTKSSARIALFDFDNYQRVFNKRYKSLTEKLARRSVFIPRVLTVLRSALAYKFHKRNYHLAVNHMSDYLPKELESMKNHHHHHDELGEIPLNKKEIVNQVEAYIKEYNIGLDELQEEIDKIEHILENKKEKNNKRKRGKKSFEVEKKTTSKFLRLIIDKSNYVERFLDLNRLIAIEFVDSDETTDGNDDAGDQLKQIEFNTMATGGSFETGQYNPRVKPKKLKLRKLLDEKQINGFQRNHLDLSLDVCMNKPRDQGQCGSCYAFASTAIFEWLHCKAHNSEPVKFSEQYLIDCAKVHMDGHGCDGGDDTLASRFVRNFGLIRAEEYPYLGKEGQCKLSESKEDVNLLQRAGQIKFNSSSAHVVPQSLWHELLHFGPLEVGLHADQMHYYGGGIRELPACNYDSSHMMVLVGYGRENGVKYWKLRNSYGPNWGERGYYRLAHSSSTCLRKFGLAYGTKNGLDYELDKFSENPFWPSKQVAMED